MAAPRGDLVPDGRVAPVETLKRRVHGGAQRAVVRLDPLVDGLENRGLNRSAAIVLLALPVAVSGAFALLYGVTFWVTAPLAVIFARDAFGQANLGALSGLITMIHHMAGGLGAYAGAALFDARGNYDAAFLVMFVLSVAALAPIMRLRGSTP